MSARARPAGPAARQPVPGVRAATGVVFRVAASPRIGFGHLVRAIHLAGALGVRPRVSIRGTVGAAGTARRLGVELLPGTVDAIVHAELALLVIDDPSRAAATPWLRAARRAGVPVVSFHDVGIAPLASDLAIDGSLGARRVGGLGLNAGACRLGTAYTVLRPSIGARRGRSRGRVPSERPTMLVGLGGGQQARAGLRIARNLRASLDRRPGPDRVRVLLSLGLDSNADYGVAELPPGIEVVPPASFRAALAQATVAVTAGGTTLYEACALGTPVVAVPVVPGQGTTVRRFVRAGLAVGVGNARVGTDAWGRAVAAAALDLLADPSRRRTLSRRGPLAIDGRGAARVARAIVALRAAWTQGTGKGTRTTA